MPCTITRTPSPISRQRAAAFCRQLPQSGRRHRARIYRHGAARRPFAGPVENRRHVRAHRGIRRQTYRRPLSVGRRRNENKIAAARAVGAPLVGARGATMRVRRRAATRAAPTTCKSRSRDATSHPSFAQATLRKAPPSKEGRRSADRRIRLESASQTRLRRLAQTVCRRGARRPLFLSRLRG